MKIPIKIYPAFWIFSALIGLLLANFDFLQMFIWVGIIFISVLFHEFGHALTALAFGQKPQIGLVAMGGVTSYDGPPLRFWKQFLITLNGPVFGGILAGGFYLLSIYVTGKVQPLLHQIFLVNVIWTVVNVLPILPLDGGQLLRIILEGIFHVKGVRYAMLTSSILAALLSLFFFVTQNIFAGAIFFLFAFENFTGFRRTKHLTQADRSDELRKALENADIQLQTGHKEEARLAFEQVRKDAKEGLIFVMASQYLAMLDVDSGHKKEAYEILLPIKEDLDPQGLALLHALAFEEKNYSLVMELGPSVFQMVQQPDVALRIAYAAGALNQAEAAVGWLETAMQGGLENVAEITKETIFDTVRSDPSFQQFLSRL
ncbi:MAG: M50 family metallopeptidase [Verrucomicrobia bacterium]|nr:M50 family metallopeptidase [Verrucomicrobiota bacterium]